MRMTSRIRLSSHWMQWGRKGKLKGAEKERRVPLQFSEDWRVSDGIELSFASCSARTRLQWHPFIFAAGISSV